MSITKPQQTETQDYWSGANELAALVFVCNIYFFNTLIFRLQSLNFFAWKLFLVATAILPVLLLVTHLFG